MLTGRIYRMEKQKSVLNKLLGNGRQKRGLFNAIGSVTKTLFGILTENDLEYVNTKLDKLYKDNGVLAISISNQIQVIKSLLNSASYDGNTSMEDSKENL